MRKANLPRRPAFCRDGDHAARARARMTDRDGVPLLRKLL